MNVGYYTDNGLKYQKFKYHDQINLRITDFTITCQDGSLQAHKMLLATRSSYFERMLEANPRLTHANIDGVRSDLVLKALEVLYGGCVFVELYRIMEFFQILHKFKINHWVEFGAGSIARRTSSSSTPPSPSTEETLSSRHSGEGESEATGNRGN